jgi:hypothetical protein
LEEKVVAASTGHPFDNMKQTNWPVTLIVAIWNSGLTNQKLNAIIFKRQVIMVGIIGVQPRGLSRMQI